MTIPDGALQGSAAEIEAAKKSGRFLQITGDDIVDIRSQLHEKPVAGLVYQEMISGMQTGLIATTAIQYAGDLLARMKPRDDLERMLIEHALWAHGRLFKLNLMLAKSDRVNDVRILSELVDRASTAFRKDLGSLAEYRRPRRRQRPLVIMPAQLNAAHQQIVNNRGEEKTNEKRIKTERRKALPPAPDQSRRSRGSARGDSKKPAMAQVDRTTKRRR